MADPECPRETACARHCPVDHAPGMPQTRSFRSTRARQPSAHGRAARGRAAPHRPLGPPQAVQFRRQRPGAMLQVLQVAVAVERPAVDAARPAAPVAGLRRTRTGVVGLRPAAALVGLVEPRSGRDDDLPGPPRLPAGHQASPPLLVAGPTNPPSGRTPPSRAAWRAPTVLPANGGMPGRARPRRPPGPCSTAATPIQRGPSRTRPPAGDNQNRVSGTDRSYP
jgi:hypothetical protein